MLILFQLHTYARISTANSTQYEQQHWGKQSGVPATSCAPGIYSCDVIYVTQQQLKCIDIRWQ